MDIDQISTIQRFEIPAHIESLDAQLKEGRTEEDLSDIEYRFKVVYTFENSSKSDAHIRFVSPDSSEAQEISHVLTKYKPADELYPYRLTDVAKIVAEKTGKPFNANFHAKAYRMYKIRPSNPPKESKNPKETDRRYCIYNSLYKYYTYSQNWVDFLINEINDKGKYEEIRNYPD
jgi:hypothetical protein